MAHPVSPQDALIHPLWLDSSEAESVKSCDLNIISPSEKETLHMYICAYIFQVN